jgi:hypothetical protein
LNFKCNEVKARLLVYYDIRRAIKVFSGLAISRASLQDELTNNQLKLKSGEIVNKI